MGKTRDNPYYYSFAEYCKNVFGRRLYRVALDAGFTCPHRDPGTGEGGCIFCSDAGSGEFSLDFHGQQLTMDDIESVLDIVDKRIMEAYLSISQDFCMEARDIWKKLQARRLGRG